MKGRKKKRKRKRMKESGEYMINEVLMKVIGKKVSSY